MQRFIYDLVILALDTSMKAQLTAVNKIPDYFVTENPTPHRHTFQSLVFEILIAPRKILRTTIDENKLTIVMSGLSKCDLLGQTTKTVAMEIDTEPSIESKTMDALITSKIRLQTKKQEHEINRIKQINKITNDPKNVPQGAKKGALASKTNTSTNKTKTKKNQTKTHMTTLHQSQNSATKKSNPSITPKKQPQAPNPKAADRGNASPKRQKQSGNGPVKKKQKSGKHESNKEKNE